MEEFRVGLENRCNREEVVGFLASIFGPDPKIARKNFNLVFDYEPSVSTRNMVYARSSKNQLVGMLRIVERTVLVDGAALNCGGVTSVAVAENWRHQGVCSALMDFAHKVLEDRGCPVSLVFARKAVDGLYERYGYSPVGRYIDLRLDVSVKDTTGVQLRPFQKKDLDFCMMSYIKYYHQLTGSYKREQGIWDFLIHRFAEGKRQFQLFVCQAEKRNIGYGVVLENTLVEFCLAPEFFSSCPSMFESLAIKSIGLHPRHPFFQYARAHWNTIFSERFAVHGGYMARFIHTPAVIRWVSQRLKSRAKRLGLQNHFVNVLDYRIDLKTGQVTPQQGKDDIIFSDFNHAVQMILGFVGPELISGAQINASKPWLLNLFPHLYFQTSKCDEF